jgi:hypothetical protein
VLNTNALALSEATIRGLFGSVADLPREMANTIANIHYRYFLLLLEARASPGSTPASIKGSGSTDRLAAYVEQTARVISAIEVIDDLCVSPD